MSIIKHDFEKMNITKIKQTKNRQKLTVITAYDALFSNLFSKSADMILVGDSLNMQIDIEKPSSKIKFSGLGAAENNFLWQWETEFGQTSKNALYPKKYKDLKEKSFRSEVEKLRNRSRQTKTRIKQTA